MDEELQNAISSGLSVRRHTKRQVALKVYSNSVPSSPVSTLSRGPIALHDNVVEDDDEEEDNHASWAKSVSVTDPRVIRTSGDAKARMGPGYVVWLCRIEPQVAAAAPIEVYRRYSEFEGLREELCMAIPQLAQRTIPRLPPKSLVSRFRGPFLERRRKGLEFFLASILLNPQLSAHPVCVVRSSVYLWLIVFRL